MNPSDRKYTKEHEWVKVEGDIGTCGITHHAQELLTDIVFVELPAIGKKVEQMKSACVVESVKSVSDVYAPMGGEVVETNKTLEGDPGKVNRDPFEEGWIFKIKLTNPPEYDTLMTADRYEAYLKTASH